MKIPAQDYSKFGVTRKRGFLPSKDPLLKLPPALSVLDEYEKELPVAVESGNIRRYLKRLPYILLPALDREEAIRAFRIYCYLASSYVHAQESSSLLLPKNIALPLTELSRKIGRHPILSYDSYCSNNFRRLDKTADITLDNLELLSRFRNSEDERGFIIIHTVIESQAGRALTSLGNIQQDVLDRENRSIALGLEQVRISLLDMYLTLTRMPDFCSPERYYLEVRPYIFSFENVVYEDVREYNGKPQNFRGETGAQSPIVPTLGTFLGIKHKETPLVKHLEIMREYMPPRHRSFIEAVAKGPSVRDYIRGSRSRMLAEHYNGCIEMLHAFRAKHYQFANTYIAAHVTDPKGTGGTIFLEWLKQLLDETLEHMIF